MHYIQYTVLTGVYPFPNTCEYAQVAERVKSGERSYVDPRWSKVSYGEGQLAHVIQKCWEQDPRSRYSIEQIVKTLEVALAKHLELEEA